MAEKILVTACYVQLNPGVDRLNFVTYLLIMFICYFVMSALYSYVSFILEDPKYYNLPHEDVAPTLAQIGMIRQVLLLAEDLAMGVLFDTVGRRVPLAAGIGLGGLCVALIPLFHHIYPSFFLCNVLAFAGAMFGLNVPLAPDYVEKSSLGLANLFVVVVGVAGNVAGAAGMLAIPDTIDQQFVYYGMGFGIALVGVLCIFGVKEVN